MGNQTLRALWRQTLETVGPKYCPIHGNEFEDDPGGSRMVCPEGHEVTYQELSDITHEQKEQHV